MIYKKINGQIDQGDILYPVRIKNHIPWWIDDDDDPVVILTPTCDIAQEKVEYHRIAILLPFPFFFLNTCHEVLGEEIDLPNLSKNNKDKIRNKLDRAIRNAWPRPHFLPKEDVFKIDRIIDFEVVASLPIEIFSPDLRIARLVSPYKEELIHRYSHHTLRIGTEDIPKETVNQIIDDCFNFDLQLS
jgi:hypothetical protein